MGKTIMCVDDSATIRMLVKKTLEPKGMQVLEAENGRKGLEALAGGAAVDMFVVDVNMPELDGFGFVKALKEDGRHASKPVVFLTTEAGADKKSMGKELGVNGWIVKPFEEASLLKIVEMLTA